MNGKSKPLPNVVDLFAGVGGLSLGAVRAGFRLKAAFEKDPYAFAAHSQNFPTSIHSNVDISTLTGDELLNIAGLIPGELDGIIGGPPCQGFSTMGHRQVTDKRNNLFKKFFTLVQEARPRFFLAENVPGILNECYDDIRADAFDVLKGYSMLPPFPVCAADYGAATSRTRILFIGYLSGEIKDLEKGDFAPPKEIPKVTVRTALSGLPIKISDSWDSDIKGWRKVRSVLGGYFGDRAHGCIPEGVGHADVLAIWRETRKTSGCIATHHTPQTVKRFSRLLPGETDKVSRGVRLKPEGLCPTLRAGTDSERGSYQAVRPIHPSEPRVITPREAARLQGFPDWFRFDKTKWHSFRQIGNSVSPILAEHILNVIYRRLSN